MVHRFSGENWEDSVLKSEKPVFVDFQLPTRPGWLVDSTGLLTLSRQWNGAAEVGYLDVSRDLAVALNYPVVDIPTLSLFHRGRVLKSHVGPNRFNQDFREAVTRHSTTFPALHGMTWIGLRP